MSAPQNIAMVASFKSAELANPINAASASLYNMETLIAEAERLADFAELKTGGVAGETFGRIKRLLWIAGEERSRAHAAVHAGEDVLTAHIIYEVVA